MVNVERGPDRGAGVVSGRLHVELGERRPIENHPVGDAVQRDAAREANPLHPCSLVHFVEQREVALFEDELHRGGKVGVMVTELGARGTRRPEDVDHLLRIDRSDDRLAAVPGHLDALAVVHEVIEVQAHLIAFDAHDVADLLGEARLAIG